MPKISNTSITDLNSQKQIIIRDLVTPTARFHANKNKHKFLQNYNTCKFNGYMQIENLQEFWVLQKTRKYMPTKLN